jgi:hypothetical protein
MSKTICLKASACVQRDTASWTDEWGPCHVGLTDQSLSALLVSCMFVVALLHGLFVLCALFERVPLLREAGCVTQAAQKVLERVAARVARHRVVLWHSGPRAKVQ